MLSLNNKVYGHRLNGTPHDSLQQARLAAPDDCFRDAISCDPVREWLRRRRGDEPGNQQHIHPSGQTRSRPGHDIHHLRLRVMMSGSICWTEDQPRSAQAGEGGRSSQTRDTSWTKTVLRVNPYSQLPRFF